MTASAFMQARVASQGDLRFMQIYGRRLFFWDVVVITFALFANSYYFFYNEADATVDVESPGLLRISLNPVALGFAILITWYLALIVSKSWNTTVAGRGLPEYLLVAKTGLAVLLTLAFAALFFKLDVPRLYVTSTFISGIVLLIAHRWAGRQWLIAQRKKGSFMNRTALLGPVDQVTKLIQRLAKDPVAGYLPVVYALPSNEITPEVEKKFKRLGIEVVDYFNAGGNFLLDRDLDAVIAIPSDFCDPDRIKRISWHLEGKNIELLVSPALVDYSGSRIASVYAGGTTLLKIEEPAFSGTKYFFKSVLDFTLVSIALVIASPIFLVTSIAILIDDFGPVFFTQTRIGRNGKPFKMVKFRSMRVGSDQQHAEMLKANASPNSVMYKNPNDPRVTRVGKFIRRWSIDELPQLFNVFIGQMSMVGPRPPLPIEVEQYEESAHRRLLVKPGITGLWQTSGRASLDWEETVRLDLDYVENWSPLGDVLLILKTVKTVIQGRGAY